jgi:predicted phosphoribosyltransferase
VVQAAQTIKPFKAIPVQKNGVSFDLTNVPTARSGLPVSVTLLFTNASIVTNSAVSYTITPSAVGSVTLSASQSGDANYKAAAPVKISFKAKYYFCLLKSWESLRDLRYEGWDTNQSVGWSERRLPMNPRFKNRSEAGMFLASRLMAYQRCEETVILALPRGGVVIGFEVAKVLLLPMDVLVVRKLGVPGHEELAMGAIATGGIRLLNEPLVHALALSPESILQVEQREEKELARREREYRGDRPACDVEGKTVILIDDGIATGSTIQAAIMSLRKRGVGRLVVAAPVAPPSVVETLRKDAEEVVCIMTPVNFRAVGAWYDDFSQTSDEEVHRLLHLNTHFCTYPSPVT